MVRGARSGGTSLVAAALCVAGAAAPVPARAEGWALDRYEPSPAGDLFLSAALPWYDSERRFAVAVVADYAHRPLRLERDGEPDEAVVDHMLVLHLQGQIALFERVGVELSAPVSMVQSGAPFAMRTRALGAYGDPVAGDLRAGLRVRLFGDAARDAVSLHVGGQLHMGFVPVNDGDHNVTDEGARGRLFVTAAGRAGRVQWSSTAGYHVRPRTLTPQAEVDDDVYLSGGVAHELLDGALVVGAEVFAAIVPATGDVNAEVLGEAHVRLADVLQVSAGVGTGMGAGPGTPTVRALARVSYAHAEPAPVEESEGSGGDSDGDEVADDLDQCVDVAAGPHPDPERLGCPEPDRDADGTPDRVDPCPDQPPGPHPDPSREGCAAVDSDADGVFDHSDQCVDQAAGPHADPTRAGCPAGDADGDGVLDHEDRCVDVAAGPHPDPARAGCGLPDSDRDMVPDVMDSCPDDPGAPHADPARAGCPGLVVVMGRQLRVMRPIFFETNRDTIQRRSFPVLSALVDALSQMEWIRQLSIEGHTDDVGDDDHNLRLSQARAEAVLGWLAEHGVAPERLRAEGFGEARPLVPNDTPEGRAENRRVEFRIVE